MPACDSCGNDYDKAFTVSRGDDSWTFDSLECAINVIAPTCEICSTRIIGHGVEADDRIFCCAHCAERAGVSGVRDRA